MIAFQKILTGIALVFALLTPAVAQAGVAVNPMLLMMEGRERYVDLNLINTSLTTNNYVVGWKFFAMAPETGRYGEVPSSTTAFDLTKHIVFSPRRITLAPSSTQKVRFALRLDGEAPPPGDYRAHFSMKEVPQQPLQTPENDPKRSTIKVDINLGFTIPVIYRVGISDATAKIGQVSVGRSAKSGKIEVSVPVEKSQSAFGILGKIGIYHVKGNDEDKVGGISNAYIFPEITRRLFKINLNVESLQSGYLRIVYEDRDGEGKVYDQVKIPIGQ